jgi:hypothetical protein
MPLFSLTMTLALIGLLAPAPRDLGQMRKPTAPESFSANAQFVGSGSTGAAAITMKIDRYSSDADRDAVLQGLKQGPYSAFLEALRKAPVVGTLTIAGQAFSIRWARQVPYENGRTIVLVTDKPVFFVGGGSVNAKSREGFDLAIVQFRMDDGGVGYSGTMAAAARLKAGDPAGVQIDDYAEKPIELRTISRDLDSR